MSNPLRLMCRLLCYGSREVSLHMSLNGLLILSGTSLFKNKRSFRLVSHLDSRDERLGLSESLKSHHLETSKY